MTSICAALQFSKDLFADSGVKGIRRVIDVSGDGPNNAGEPVVPVRDELVAGGIVINGLPIMLNTAVDGHFDIGDLDRYYADCVIGGTGAFMVPVENWRSSRPPSAASCSSRSPARAARAHYSRADSAAGRLRLPDRREAVAVVFRSHTELMRAPCRGDGCGDCRRLAIRSSFCNHSLFKCFLLTAPKRRSGSFSPADGLHQELVGVASYAEHHEAFR